MELSLQQESLFIRMSLMFRLQILSVIRMALIYSIHILSGIRMALIYSIHVLSGIRMALIYSIHVLSHWKNKRCHFLCQEHVKEQSVSFWASGVCHKNRVCRFLCQEHVKQRSESFLASKACQKTKCVISYMKSVSLHYRHALKKIGHGWVMANWVN